MTITHNLFLALAGLAVVPLASGRAGWLSRLLNRRPLMAAAAPPMIENEAGWQLVHSEDADAFNRWLKKDSTGLPLTPNEEPALGSHLLIELFGCEPASLELEETVGTAMREAAIASEATVVTESFHEFKPYGVSGAVIIQESHYTIHTWPEHGYAAVDLFYCGGAIRVDEAVEVLRERFSPKRIKLLIVRRGIESEVRA